MKDVTESGPIEVSGSGSVSFAELEASERGLKSEKKQELKLEKEVEKELESEDKPKKKDKVKESDEKESDKSEGKEDEDNGKEKESKKEKLLKKDEKTDSDKAAKVFKIKNGEEFVSLPTTATIPVKIDGKTEFLPLQEVVTGYSGQSSLNKKYKEYKQELATYEDSKSKLRNMVETVHDLMVNKKDHRAMIEFIAEQLGQDPIKTYREIMGASKEQLKKMSELSEEEQNFLDIQKENEYLRKKVENENAQKEKLKIQQELEAKAKKVMTQLNMTENDFIDTYDRLKDAGVESPTIDDVAYLWRHESWSNRINKAVEEIAPDSENKDQAVKELLKFVMTDESGLDDESLRQVITEVLGNAPTERLKRKIEKGQKKAAAETPVRNPQKDPISFADLYS